MKPLQYPLHITPAMVRTVHVFYVNHTRRQVKLDGRIEEGWLRLLSAETLAGEPVTVDDVQLVIRYLYKRVTDPGKLGQRNPGCLKLNADNLFDIARFRDDLCEARSIMGRRRAPQPPTHQVQQIGDIRRSVDVAPPSPDPEPVSESIKRFLEDLAARKARKGAVA
jgi:hypothetical protein